MAAWPNNPAIVYNIAYDVLASNDIGDALFHNWAHSRNLLQIVFTDPGARTFYRDWEQVASNSVAGFRLNHGRSSDHPRIQRVLGDLLTVAPEFTRLWERHDPRGKAMEQKRFYHRDVGELTLSMQHSMCGPARVKNSSFTTHLIRAVPKRLPCSARCRPPTMQARLRKTISGRKRLSWPIALACTKFGEPRQ
jgi:MmyB-like transcription regulator ligand binding domain